MKPWVKVSTCPVGKYRDTSRYSSRGWNAFYTVYQDPQGWLGEGIPGSDISRDDVSILSLDQETDDRLFRGSHLFLHPDEEVDRNRAINFIRNQTTGYS